MSHSERKEKRHSGLLEESSALFERTEIPFERSSEEVWKGLSDRLHPESQIEVPTRKLFSGDNRRWIAVAASLALLLSVGAFLRLYQRTFVCPSGGTAELQLPDGSMTELNSGTTLSFRPLWWPYSREVRLDGEAFFNVKEGKRFEVVTSSGTAEVLGTTFNVLAREERFSVTCHTGRVRVKPASAENAVTLSPNETAELKSTGELEVRKVRVDPAVPSWKSQLMMFTSAPLREVFDEIEHRFNVRIETPKQLNHIYTGNFSRDQPVENIISLICRPFGLVYEKRAGSEYRVYPPPD